jgi:hypothetical protein
MKNIVLSVDLPQLVLCPWCGYGFDCATSPAAKSGPKEGDVSVCFNCGELAQFNTDLTLRKCDDEVQLFLDMPDVTRATVIAGQAYIKTRGRLKK